MPGLCGGQFGLSKTISIARTLRQTTDVLESGLTRKKVIVVKVPAGDCANKVIRRIGTVEALKVHSLVQPGTKAINTNGESVAWVGHDAKLAIDLVFLR